jgi:hypothetical protein
MENSDAVVCVADKKADDASDVVSLDDKEEASFRIYK